MSFYLDRREMTGTCGFETGFNGLTDMTAVFQKAKEYTLIGWKNIYCFLDDILKISKVTKDDNKQYLIECLRRLQEEHFRSNLPKCHFAKLEIDCLGYNTSWSAFLPIESKKSTILSPKAPKTRKFDHFVVQNIILVKLFHVLLKEAMH